jgi:hypothetical protein
VKRIQVSYTERRASRSVSAQYASETNPAKFEWGEKMQKEALVSVRSDVL